MSKFGKSPYWQTAKEIHREQFIEDCERLTRREWGTKPISAPKPVKQGTIQAMEY